MPRGRRTEKGDDLAAVLCLLPDRFGERDVMAIAVRLGYAPWQGVRWWYGLKKFGLVVRTGIPLRPGGRKRFYWQRTPGSAPELREWRNTTTPLLVRGLAVRDWLS